MAKKCFTFLLAGIVLLLLSDYLSAQTQNITFTVPNSPTQYAYASNSLIDAGWTTFTRVDTGLIASVSVTFTWTTDDWPDEGSFVIRHPDNTTYNLITNGVTSTGLTITANSTNTYTIYFTTFANKLIAGTWGMYIIDSYGDGGHEATNITVSIDYTIPPPMTYSSSTTLQVTNAVAPGAPKAPVIAIRITTSGLNPAINTTNFYLSTAGTTDLGDISNARIYYTGNSATFDTTTQFGTVVVTPTATFNILGNQTLVFGDNYFWLTFDVDSFATQYNFIDATCDSIVVNGVTRFPAISNPTGSRKIVAPFNGNYYVGTGQVYTNLSSLAFDISSVGLTGIVNIYVKNDITEPQRITFFTPPMGNGYQVRIRPDANTTATISANHGSQVMLIDGFNNIRIDGSNVPGGTTRNLTFANNSTASVAHGIFVQNCSMFELKNANIQNGSSNTGTGIVISTVNTATIQNNAITKANIGMTIQNNSQNINIIGNQIGSMTISNTVSVAGINFGTGTGFTTSCDGFNVSNNKIDGLIYTGTSATFTYAFLISNAVNGVVENNKVLNVVNSAGNHISFRITATESTPPRDLSLIVRNNSVSNVSVSASSGNYFGFYNTTSQNVKILHNTINIGSSSVAPVAIGQRYQTGCLNYQVNNNIFVINPATTGGLKYIYYLDATQATTPFSNINYNLYNLMTGANFAFYLGAAQATLANWTTALGGGTADSDLNSLMKLPTFASAGTPYLEGSVLADPQYIVPLHNDVETDIDGETRTTLNNLAGADILIPSEIQFTTNLPQFKEETAGVTALVYSVTPQLGTTFNDGITRTPPTGDLPAMNYMWFFNNNEIQTGVNNFIINRNNLSIVNTNATNHNGQYYCIVNFFGTYGVTNTSTLSIVNLPRPVLVSPVSGTQNVPITQVFSWSSVNTALQYQIQVAFDENFQYIFASNIVGTNSTSFANLPYFANMFWRVRAIRNADTSLWSEVWTFKTVGPPMAPPAIIAPDNNSIDLPLTVSFVWYSFLSATGYTLQVSTVSNFSTTIFNQVVTDTSVTISNLLPNTQYYWRVRSLRGTEISAWSTVRTFTTGSGLIIQSYSLWNGWNMISAYVEPTISSISSIMQPLTGNLQMLRNFAGQVYSPPVTNTLTNWDKYQAYQMRLTTSTVYNLEGTQIVPENTPITLNMLGWYWIPYYRTSPAPVATALASISGKYLQVKTITGQVYMPPFANTLTQLEPGKGYMIRLIANNGILTYPANGAIKSTANNSNIKEPKYFVRPNLSTGKNAFIALDIKANEGDEIGVFTRDGMLVGSSVWQDGLRGVVVWGDDEYTIEKDGAYEGEELIIKILNKSNEAIGKLCITENVDLASGNSYYSLRYETDAVVMLKGKVEFEPTNVMIAPQPATNELYITLGQVSDNTVDVDIYNQNGDLVFRNNVNHTNGAIKLNVSNLPSGVYNVIIRSGNTTLKERALILR
ncbi:MAG: BNR-repeat neuraminidase N-terminal domain-containing protein [Bacteroidota bacterium]